GRRPAPDRSAEPPERSALGAAAADRDRRRSAALLRPAERRSDLVIRADAGRARGHNVPPAPVAQWIEQRFPKPRAHVRFMPGASGAGPGLRSLTLAAADDQVDLRAALQPPAGPRRFAENPVLLCLRRGFVAHRTDLAVGLDDP